MPVAPNSRFRVTSRELAILEQAELCLSFRSLSGDLEWVVRQFARTFEGDRTPAPSEGVKVVVNRDGPPALHIAPHSAPQWDWLNRIGLVDDAMWSQERGKFAEQHRPAAARNSVMYLAVRYLSHRGGGRRSVDDAGELYEFWRNEKFGVEEKWDKGSYYRFLRERIDPLMERRAS